jgi:hypothetical protein
VQNAAGRAERTAAKDVQRNDRVYLREMQKGPEFEKNFPHLARRMRADHPDWF